MLLLENSNCVVQELCTVALPWSGQYLSLGSVLLSLLQKLYNFETAWLPAEIYEFKI
jgi:hypothetical protein